jgi:hypothetical protein
MGILSRVFGRGKKPPEWAGFMDGEEFKAFGEALTKELEKLGFKHQLELEEGMAEVQIGDNDPHRLGLLNLAQLCNANDRKHWPEIIDQHLDKLILTRAERESILEQLAYSFEAARPYLKVRLYPDELGDMVEHMVHYRPAEGLLAVLMYDLPDSVASVAKSHVENWGRSTEELFRIGLEHVRDEPGMDADAFEAEKGISFQLLGGESHFVASRSLLLDEYLTEGCPHGVLVAMPHRHVVLYHPIKDLSVVKAISSLIAVAHGMYSKGPGSITPNIYWYRNGEYLLLPSKVEGRNIEFVPPQRFVNECLNLLGPPADTD